jgi:hypothetical protein
MNKFYILGFITFCWCHSLHGQKIMQLEWANRVRARKFYVGESLYFRLKGPENYWYLREITDIRPDSIILLDAVPVKIGDIAAIKLPKPRVYNIIGSALISFGGTLVLATTYSLGKGDQPNIKALYPVAAGCLGTGIWMVKPKKHVMGKKRRLRLLQIDYPGTVIKN